MSSSEYPSPATRTRSRSKKPSIRFTSWPGAASSAAIRAQALWALSQNPIGPGIGARRGSKPSSATSASASAWRSGERARPA